MPSGGFRLREHRLDEGVEGGQKRTPDSTPLRIDVGLPELRGAGGIISGVRERGVPAYGLV